MNWDFLQWIGCLTGVAGAWLLGRAKPTPTHQAWGFGCFLLSNLFWVTWGVLFHAHGLLVMQALFTVTSVRGLWNARKADGACDGPAILPH